MINSRIRFFIKRLRERLWVRPLSYCLLSVGAAFIAKGFDAISLPEYAPAIAADTNHTLLQIMAASMLVIATLAVTSMVSAYSSASNAATPRTFPLIVADDVSQKALSTFLAAFIFSIVSLVAVENSFFAKTGHLVLFLLTLFIFAWVIATFVRWVDAIARLGRLGTAVDKVEAAASDALRLRALYPAMGGVVASGDEGSNGHDLYSEQIGYVQHIKMNELQRVATEANAKILLQSPPGRFITPGNALVTVFDLDDAASLSEEHAECIRSAFLVGGDRVFDDDPRFGLIVLSEVAGRALSPAVNDPGTAIDIIGTLTRLILNWDATAPDPEKNGQFDRVFVPSLNVDEMFDDAFTSVARDGAGQVEVAVRLQKAFGVLASQCHEAISNAARRHSDIALKRAENAMAIDDDLQAVRAVHGRAEKLT